jgi:GT2 family glycosyltransferase
MDRGPEPPAVSVLFNTLERFALTRDCVDQALENTGFEDYEILACDQGSKDERLRRYLGRLPNLAYLRLNAENCGNYQMLNQLLLRAVGRYLCVIDPDILLPENWLFELVRTHQLLSKSLRPGISGLHCVEARGAFTTTDGGVKVFVREGGEYEPSAYAQFARNVAIFGTKFWSREVLDEIGYFCEDYGVYGHGDTDYGYRAWRAGFTNYYLGEKASAHAGADFHEDTEQRQMKTANMRAHKGMALTNLRKYRSGAYYVAPPEVMP